jgi:hypothetical protein
MGQWVNSFHSPIFYLYFTSKNEKDHSKLLKIGTEFLIMQDTVQKTTTNGK